MDDETISREQGMKMIEQVRNDTTQEMLLLFEQVLSKIETLRPIKLSFNRKTRELLYQIGDDEPEAVKVKIDHIDPNAN